VLAHSWYLLYCCGDEDCFPVACDQLVGTVYGRLYVPTGNLFDAEQGATAKAIGDAFGISEESVRCIIEATSGQRRMDSIKTIRPAVLFDANKNSPGVGRAKATWWGVSYTQTPL
jgi:hypothetical protein